MENNTPVVSVLMTTYNRAHYIEEAIESVISSSFQDWELIIVDDCSDDNTQELVQKYLSDRRIFYHRNVANLGQFINRNKAASLSRGKYIKYLDSDDIIYPYGLEVMVNTLNANKNAGIAVPYLGNLTSQPYPFTIDSTLGIIKHFMGGNFLSLGPSGTIFKREIFYEVNGFEPDMGILADTHLTLKIAGLSKEIAFFQKDLVYWRIHDQQVTVGQSDKCKMIIERYLLIEDFLLRHKTGLTPGHAGSLINIYRANVARHVLLFSFKGKIRDAFDIVKQTKLTIVDIFVSIIPIKLRYSSMNKFRR
jgi:Glycosyltransferases involved in cell wall biogenesis